MRHVRMWIRGYAFEVDCARGAGTSGAPRISCVVETEISGERTSARILSKTSESERRGEERERGKKRNGAFCSRKMSPPLFCLRRRKKPGGEGESTRLVLAGVSRKICKTTHVSVVLMRLLDARRRQRESFADTRVRYYEFFNTIESGTREKLSNARNRIY